MRTLCETSLLQFLTYKSNSAYAHVTNRPGIPTSNMSMARTHMHITSTLDDICLTYRVLEHLARSPAHSVHIPSPSYTTIFEPKSTAQRVSSTHNTSPIPHNHRASLLAAIPTATGDHYYQLDRYEFHQQIFRV